MRQTPSSGLAAPHPERTSYIGRAGESEQARALLRGGSLVTLTGVGGVGKTRLARRVAAAVAGAYPDGTAFVELAELHEPELLAHTVAAELGLYDQSARPQLEVVIDHLRDRRFLLVLDNCEHLVAECAALASGLIAACPRLSVLATSRQSLNVRGERLLPVPPLPVPDASEVRGPDALAGHDAPRLFLDRGRAVRPSLAATEHNYLDILELCRSLDGLPLAIELAAVRLRALSVRQLRERLADPLALLTRGSRDAPARHRALRPLIDWSYALCSEPEQRVLARVSVFSGGFGLAAAEEVCAFDGVRRRDVLDVLHGLVEKSLLIAEEAGDGADGGDGGDRGDGEVRYRMLETLREYGAELLARAAETERVARAHRDWCAGLIARYEARWVGPDQVAWVRRISREHANVRVALDHCAATPGEAAVGLRMANQLDAYWIIRGFLSEARVWLAKLMASVGPEAPERALSRRLHARCALIQGDEAAALADVRLGHELARRDGDEITAAYAEVIRGLANLYFGSEPDARPAEQFALALEVFRRNGMRSSAEYAAFNFRHATAMSGTLEEGRALLAESIAAGEAMGEVFWRSWDWWALSLTEVLFGDPEAAERAGLEAFRLQRVLGNRSAEPFTVHTLGASAARRGDMVRSAVLFGVSSTLWKAIGTDPRHFSRFTAHGIELATRVFEALGPEDYRRHFRRGRALSGEEAGRYVLGAPASRAVPAQGPEAPLTPRERQVADLVARGMTNKEIAAELVISPRTAETHVENILAKLGFTSRARLAAWVVRRS